MITLLQAKKDLVILFEALTQEERDTLVNHKGKLAPKDKKKTAPTVGHTTNRTEDIKRSPVQQQQNSDTDGQAAVSIFVVYLLAFHLGFDPES